MRTLILDNYDSFTYNLFHYVEKQCDDTDEVDVIRNDGITVENALNYDNIILSPGPGLPSESGIMAELLRDDRAKKPILGICLGHQAIAEADGCKLSLINKPLHGYEGKTVIKNESPLFQGMNNPILTGHYHSWVVSSEQISSNIRIDAIGENGEIMAISHKKLPRFGIQFHPESIMTVEGDKIIENWIAFCKHHTQIPVLR
jgi:anthranilate synthase component 2